MNARKRDRNTTADDDIHDQTNKLQRTSSSSLTTINTHRYSITCFEDLANDVIYDIFDYLDAHHIYQGFFKLNIRFQNLLSHINVPIKVDIANFSKTQFQNYYIDFIKPMQHRMRILHVLDPFTIEYIFPLAEDISIYSQLKTLYLENIESQYLVTLLQHLVVLPCLSSLIMKIGHGTNKVNIYNRLFQLPVLKYCELYFQEISPLLSRSICPNSSSCIELLIVDDQYDFNEIDALLSCLPKLRRLSITREHVPLLVSILFNDLTQLSFSFISLQSDDIDNFMKKYFHQIKLLHFCKTFYEHSHISDTWNKPVLSYLPHVKFINLRGAKEILCAYTLKLYTFSAHNYFRSRRMEQSFFTHEPISEENLHQLFCSLAPYRKKYCTINQDCRWNQPICHAQNVLNSVRYMTIDDLKVIDNSSQYFPNVIEFTFDSRYFNSWTLFSTNGFGRMIPLVHLHKLNMNSIYLNFNVLIDILLHASNIHTLTVQTLEITMKEVSALEESENFRLVSKQNKIKNISISNYLVVTIKTLINLCPRLHHLSLGTDRQPFEATIRYLRSNTNETVCHVSSLSLYMFNVNEQLIARLKSAVESNKRVGDYSLKFLHHRLYIWW